MMRRKVMRMRVIEVHQILPVGGVGTGVRVQRLHGDARRNGGQRWRRVGVRREDGRVIDRAGGDRRRVVHRNAIDNAEAVGRRRRDRQEEMAGQRGGDEVLQPLPGVHRVEGLWQQLLHAQRNDLHKVAPRPGDDIRSGDSGSRC